MALIINNVSCINNKKESYCFLVEEKVHDSFCEKICKGNYVYYKKYINKINKNVENINNELLYQNKYQSFFSSIDQDFKEDYLVDMEKTGELTHSQAIFIAKKEKIKGYIQHSKNILKEDNVYEKYNTLISIMSKEQKEQYLINLVSSGELTADQALYISVVENS